MNTKSIEAMSVAMKDIRNELRKNHKTYINCSLKALRTFNTLCAEHGLDNSVIITDYIDNPIDINPFIN